MTRRAITERARTGVVRGRIVAFDRRTWWGEAVYDLTVVEFHGTNVQGMRNDDAYYLVGRVCDLVFNGAGVLFDVRLVKEGS